MKLISHSIAAIPKIEQLRGYRRVGIRGVFAASTDDDILLIDERPDPSLLDYYASVGFPRPKIFVPEDALRVPDVVCAALADQECLKLLRSQPDLTEADFFTASWPAEVLS